MKINKINENIDSESIININSNSYEFIMLINISHNDIIININSKTEILEQENSIFLSNKIKYDFIDQNGDIILLHISYYNGYNRYDYNKHPNQNINV